MPLYEYSCQKCHTVVERIQKFSDPPLQVCETCGGPLVRLMGKPALQFKGSGFYITDYVKKNGDGGSSKGEGKSEQPSSAPAASSGDSASSAPSTAAPAAAPAAPAPASSTT